MFQNLYVFFWNRHIFLEHGATFFGTERCFCRFSTKTEKTLLIKIK